MQKCFDIQLEAQLVEYFACYIGSTNPSKWKGSISQAIGVHVRSSNKACPGSTTPSFVASLRWYSLMYATGGTT